MNTAQRRITDKEHAQGMVEFALILPLLLVMIFAVIEFGRLVFIYSATMTASREASRYGSASGDAGGGILYFQDCAGMRASARRLGSLAGIQDADIQINYDDGPGTNVFGSCPVGGTGPSDITLHQRVRVQVVAQYQPLLPLVQAPPFPITSFSARSVLKDVDIGEAGTIGTTTPTVYFDSETSSFAEGNAPGTLNVGVRLTNPTNMVVWVTISLEASSTATLGQDFTLSASPFQIPAGSTSGNFSINVLTDTLDEYDETVVLKITAATNANIGSPDVHTATIVDEDTPPDVHFAAAASSTFETGGTHSVIVTLTRPSGKDVSVNYQMNNITAVHGLDYTGTATGTVNIPKGSQSAIIMVTSVADGLYEDAETMSITLQNPVVNAVITTPSTHTVTIHSQDPMPSVTFVLNGQSGGENVGQMLVAVSLSAVSGKDVTVPYYIDSSSTATSGFDYNIQPSPLVLPAGVQNATFAVTILPDLLTEPNETIDIRMNTMQIVGAAPGAQTRHVITILPVTTLPTVRFAATSQTVNEGVATVNVTVLLSSVSSQDILVPFVLTGTASTGTDYSLAANPLTIPHGLASMNLVVNITNDVYDEENETIILTMGTPVNATLGTPTVHTITIADDDNPPTVFFEPAAQSADEGAGSTTVEIRLSALSGKVVTVPFSINNLSTAATGADFTVNTAPVVIAPGMASGTVTINIVDDAVINEGSETAVLQLGTPTNASIGNPATHTLTILENDALVCPSGGSLTFYPNSTKLTLPLYNTSPNAEVVDITSLTIRWPDGPSKKLEQINLDSSNIWSRSGNQGSTSPTYILSGDWESGGDRSLGNTAPSNQKTLTFTFNFNLTASSTFIVTINFSNGCFWSSQ